MEKQKLPNSTLILVFGILGIVGTCCYGIPGLLFAIIGLVLAQRSLKLYKQEPDLYEDVSQVKTGKILSIIALVLSVLVVLLIIAVIAYFGWDTLQDQELLRQKVESMQQRT